MANFDILKSIDLGISYPGWTEPIRNGRFFLPTQIAHVMLLELDPDIPNHEWPRSDGLTPGPTIPSQAAFITEGTHTEPTIGQIWPR